MMKMADNKKVCCLKCDRVLYCHKSPWYPDLCKKDRDDCSNIKRINYKEVRNRHILQELDDLANN